METQTFKVVRFYETGDASVLKLEDAPIEAPKANEVRIRVEAIGLNRAEVMFREGQYLDALAARRQDASEHTLDGELGTQERADHGG